jgi:hypothetical protein
MNADDNRFDQLQERIKSHPGKPIFEALRVYDMSKFILDGNSTQLRQLICILEDPKDPAQIVGIDRRSHLQWLFRDVNRHFHNFLTSIATLVDHTRNLIKEDFVKPEHRQEYQLKVKDVFATDPLAQFLKNFRNYITHYEIPHLGLDIQLGSFEAGAEPRKLFIELDQLETNKFDWSVPSRKFIEANKPKMRMLKLVDDYELKSKNFYDELMLTFQKHLGRELNEVLSMMQESNNLWEKMMKDMETKH